MFYHVTDDKESRSQSHRDNYNERDEDRVCQDRPPAMPSLWWSQHRKARFMLINTAFDCVLQFARSKRDNGNGQEMRGGTQDQERDEPDKGAKRDVRGENRDESDEVCEMTGKNKHKDNCQGLSGKRQPQGLRRYISAAATSSIVCLDQTPQLRPVLISFSQ